MSEWIAWLVVAGVLIVMELFSGTFYLLMIAFGLCGGALVAWFGLGLLTQIITAAVVGSVGILLLRRSGVGQQTSVVTSRDPNVNLDIGQSLEVSKWSAAGQGTFSARALHRGAQWDVICISQADPKPGRFVIIEIEGSRLIVEPVIA